jgi:hypothetical protein
VIESGASPVGSAVANGTVRGKGRLDMIRIRRAVVQRDMASAAVRGRSGENVIGVALSTLNAGVAAG